MKESLPTKEHEPVHCTKCAKLVSQDDAVTFKKAIDNDWDTPASEIAFETLTFCNQDCLNMWHKEEYGWDAPSSNDPSCALEK